MRRFTFALIPLFVTLTVPISLHADIYGKLTGRISSAATGEPLIGVNVVVVGTSLGSATDKNGRYIITTLRPGQYTVRANFIGYATYEIRNVLINADHTTQIDMQLTIEAVAGRDVVVSATRPVIQKDQTATTTIITSETIDALPVNSYTEVLDNIAGVIESNNAGAEDNGFHIRGGRTGEIAFMVDGFFVEDAILGGMGADVTRGGIEELSVITGSFNAEYGEAMSGVINIVTKEGGNQLSATVRGVTDKPGGVLDEFAAWNSDRVEFSLGGPLPVLNGNFFVAGDKYNTDTYLSNTVHKTAVYNSTWDPDEDFTDLNDNGTWDTGEPFEDLPVAFDLDHDGEVGLEERLGKNHVHHNATFRNESRLNGKVVIRPLNQLRVELGGNFSRNNFRNYSQSYKQFPERAGQDWQDSDLNYLNLNYSFSANTFLNLRYSTFENRSYYGRDRFLRKTSGWNRRPDIWKTNVTIPWTVRRDTNGDGKIDAADQEFEWWSWYAEPFEDINGNNAYDINPFNEPFIDWNENGGFDSGIDEPWEDLDGNGVWDDGENFTDWNGDSLWSSGLDEPFTDWNGDLQWTVDLIDNWFDANGDGTYSWGINPPLREGDAFGGTSNYEFWGDYTVYDANGDSVRKAISEFTGFRSYSSKSTTISGAFTSQLNLRHQLKVGFETKDLELNYFRIASMNGGPYGLANDPAFVAWQFKPNQGNGYLQDKMEFDDLIINLGLRYDWLEPKARYVQNALGGIAYDTLSTGEVVWGYYSESGEFIRAPEASRKRKFSPRLGIGYPVTDRVAFHFSYGHFFQYPEYNQMYRLSNLYPNSEYGNSLYPFPFSIQDWYIPPVGNPNLKPETTVAYEFGLRTQVSEHYVFNVTLFYKDIYDYISAVIYDADPTQYAVFENLDYGNSRGVEFTFRKLYSDNWSADLIYTLSRAEGNAANEWTHWDEAYLASVYGTYPARKTITMPWNQPHTMSFSFTYANPLWRAGLSLLGNYGSGLPYTPTDIRGRPVDESNSGDMPPTAKVDLRAYKDFILGSITAKLFFDVTNVFDSRNVLDVFSTSGKPDDSLNPESSLESEDRPSFFAPPRHIEMGISLRWN